MSMTMTAKMTTWDIMLLLLGSLTCADAALRYSGGAMGNTFQLDVALVILTGLTVLSLCYAMFKHAGARGWCTGFVLLCLVIIFSLILCQLNGVNDLPLQITNMVLGASLGLLGLNQLLWTELPAAAVLETSKERKRY